MSSLENTTQRKSVTTADYKRFIFQQGNKSVTSQGLLLLLVTSEKSGDLRHLHYTVLLTTLHYPNRQPVYFITWALKSIKPQWICWGRENEQTVLPAFVANSSAHIQTNGALHLRDETTQSLRSADSVELKLHKWRFG